MTQMLSTPKGAKPIDIGNFKVTICPPAKPFIDDAKRRQKVAKEATRLKIRLEKEARRREIEELEAKERDRNRKKARKGKAQLRNFFF